jgi:hypothetical protein
MLDKGLRLIQQATDLQHVPGLVLKRNAQFPLDVDEVYLDITPVISIRIYSFDVERSSFGERA